MSTYVISDIHGQYNSYKKMLEKIKFSSKDFLYVLGDCIDRGPDGINVIKDIMKRDNAELILGNHEVMLLNSIEHIRDTEAGKEPSNMTEDGLSPLELWTHPCNGGEGTCLEFLGLPAGEQSQSKSSFVIVDLSRELRLMARAISLLILIQSIRHLVTRFYIRKLIVPQWRA